MAVAGLPDPRKDHAVVMARFSRECLQAMEFLTRKMEVSLGPDTTDLCMRVGLHTGPGTLLFYLYIHGMSRMSSFFVPHLGSIVFLSYLVHNSDGWRLTRGSGSISTVSAKFTESELLAFKHLKSAPHQFALCGSDVLFQLRRHCQHGQSNGINRDPKSHPSISRIYE